MTNVRLILNCSDWKLGVSTFQIGCLKIDGFHLKKNVERLLSNSTH